MRILPAVGGEGGQRSWCFRFRQAIIIPYWRKNMSRLPQYPSAPSPYNDRAESNRSFRSNTPHPTFHPREPSIMALLGQEGGQPGSKIDIQLQQKEMSVRSVNTTKTNSRVSYRHVLQPTTPLPFFQGTECEGEDARGYEAIERILRSENANLKNQNQLLLREVHKLKKSNYAYREEYRQIKVQLEQAREECEAHRQRADEMKEIIMSRLASLQGKFNLDGSSHFAIEECESILEALTFSQSEIK